MSGAPVATPAGSPGDVARWRGNLQGERAGELTLRRLSARERRPALAAALTKLADAEAGQAAYWAGKLAATGASDPLFQPALRDRLLLALAGWVPPRALLPIIAAEAVRGVEAYRAQPDAAAILPAEVAVARAATALAHGTTVAPADTAPDHRRTVAGNGSLRAAVFGVNDGLTSNLSLVMGVAGAATDNQWILLTGLAGLLAGAFSMGGGEFISMLSQRELFEKEIAVERQHLATVPDAERANLTEIYREKGLAPEQAEAIASQLMADPSVALDTIAREQLGLDPDELGSPRAAAAASFVSFSIGAAFPIVPFVLLQGPLAVLCAFLLSGLGLFVVGALLSLFTARNPLVSGARMLAIGLSAAAATYVIGRLIGVSVAG